MKALRMFALAAALIGSMTLAACTSGGCCGKDGCGCSMDRSCCGGCAAGTGCTCK